MGPLVIFLQNFYGGIHSIGISKNLTGSNPAFQRVIGILKKILCFFLHSKWSLKTMELKLHNNTFSVGKCTMFNLLITVRLLQPMGYNRYSFSTKRGIQKGKCEKKALCT
jgi:hypothetical protein